MEGEEYPSFESRLLNWIVDTLLATTGAVGEKMWLIRHRFERKELSVRWSRPMERPPLGGEGYQRDGASSRFTHLIIFTKIPKQLSRKLLADSKFSQCHLW
ncbi:hypothetical protein MTR_8g056760 [Medicago truncatula]|uniref:Uncharacterized protein n=1 Tax=Medicago truncatula TaxID=3880 RepID=G7LB02_MEDTR|nr:hypothetical protein MTR_8g056760 [Medicago truncatula]